MTFEIKELDYQQTPLGDISLRRRSEPRLDGKILYEVKLAELKTTHHKQNLDLVVGGLGLGYTAGTVLEDPAVRSLTVIEVMQPVIDWHRRGLVPLGKSLTEDPRCTLLHHDFFELAASPHGGFDLTDLTAPTRRVHAVLVDIDHSPSHWLNPQNSAFYTAPAFENLANKLHPVGLFGLWSNDPRTPNSSTCSTPYSTLPNPIS